MSDSPRLQQHLAPEAGLEPATRRLTAGCSTIELLWNSDPSFRPILFRPDPQELPWDPTEGRNLLGSPGAVKRIYD